MLERQKLEAAMHQLGKGKTSRAKSCSPPSIHRLFSRPSMLDVVKGTAKMKIPPSPRKEDFASLSPASDEAAPAAAAADGNEAGGGGGGPTSAQSANSSSHNDEDATVQAATKAAASDSVTVPSVSPQQQQHQDHVGSQSSAVAKYVMTTCLYLSNLNLNYAMDFSGQSRANATQQRVA